GSEEAGLCMGRRGRWMADQRRRLGPAALQVSQRGPGHEGVGRQDSRSGFSGAALVGSAGGQTRVQRGHQSSRGIIAERGWLETENLLLERLVFLPRR